MRLDSKEQKIQTADMYELLAKSLRDSIKREENKVTITKTITTCYECPNCARGSTPGYPDIVNRCSLVDGIYSTPWEGPDSGIGKKVIDTQYIPDWCPLLNKESK